MLRVAASMSFALVSCTTIPIAPAPTAAKVRPVAVEDSLEGRWTITAVNGRQVSGLWLELGGEGLGKDTKTSDGVNVSSPQPLTRAYLGCNDWYPNGWIRNGDKLKLGTQMSGRTERGCDSATMALDDAAYEILKETMTMELTAPDGLRLINDGGTLDLVRAERRNFQ